MLNAKKAADSRAAIRVPFTRLIPTALKVGAVRASSERRVPCSISGTRSAQHLQANPAGCRLPACLAQRSGSNACARSDLSCRYLAMPLPGGAGMRPLHARARPYVHPQTHSHTDTLTHSIGTSSNTDTEKGTGLMNHHYYVHR